MTDYGKMDHQTLYNYVHSGNPDAMNSTAQSWQNHSQALEQATSELQSNLTAIQSQWQGAAADAYFQQSQDVATKMQTHADNAANTSTAVTNTANALSWARTNMPSPPSWMEQQAAKVDSNIVTGAIGFFTTDGAATVASEMAKHDIANKHQQAISTMTQLAGAYTSAESQLPNAAFIHKDPNNGDGNGNGSGSGTPPVMPVPMYPIGGTGGGGGAGGGYPGGPGIGGHLGGGGAGGGVAGGFGSGGAGGSAGSGSGVKVPSFADPGGDTFTQGTGAAGGPAGGGLGGTSNPYGAPGESAGGIGGGAGQYGSGIGTGGAGMGALGAGAGALGAGEFASGTGGGYGTRKGGTDLGSGEGSGIWGGEGQGGASNRYGSAAAAGEDEAATGGAAGAQGQGMMGGAGGHGGPGGSSEERGNRAGFLRQDPDYWYGDKQAAPPGGVIE